MMILMMAAAAVVIIIIIIIIISGGSSSSSSIIGAGFNGLAKYERTRTRERARALRAGPKAGEEPLREFNCEASRK